ncbi:unnamed protein product, partial [Adineta ricciae]
EWIESLFQTNNRIRYYHPLDFRLIASSQFETLALLCRTVSSFINDQIYGEFASMLMVSPQLSTRLIFEAEVSDIVKQFQINTVTSLVRANRLLNTMLEQNLIMSALKTNFFTTMIPGSRVFDTYWSIYPTDIMTNETDPFSTSVPSCSCTSTFECTFPAGIYNEDPRNGLGGLILPQSPPLAIIPGILTGCTPSSSILQSTLECFFNRSCLTMLDDPFNGTIVLTKSRFSPNTTVNVLFTELFLESLHNTSDYISYFSECAPLMCTYIYSRRFDVLHMVTTVTSIFGGLCVIFRLLSPLLIKFYRRITLVRTEIEQLEEAEEIHPGTSTRLLQIFRLVKEKILTFDLFESDNIHIGIISTRVYVSLLLIGAITFSIYTSLATDMYTITIRSPTLAQYENAELIYSSNLICSCSDLSIKYNKIMNIQVHYHQVCSSAFITDVWLAYFDLGPRAALLSWNSNDFRVTGQIFFSLLQVLCDMADEIIDGAVNNFNLTDLITSNLLTRNDFDAQTAIIIAQFELETVASFTRLFELIRVSISDNQLFAAPSTSAIFAPQNNQTIGFIPITQNNNCSCGISSQCSGLRGFYPMWILGMPFNTEGSAQLVPGFVGACFPIEAGLLSSLECIYDPSCLALLIAWRSFNISDTVIKPLERATLNISTLNPYIKSRFLPNTTVDIITGQLFIEEWITLSNYEKYYKQCAPTECTYTYTRGFDILHMIANLIGIWTGLTLCLRLTVPVGMKIIFKCLSIRSTNQRTVILVAEVPLRRKFVRLCSALWSINVFSKVTTMTIIMQRTATRLYFILLYGCLISILLFFTFQQQTYTETISTPNASIVNALYQQTNIFSLKCPCSQNSVPYSMFVSISSVRHIICSSAFVTTPWWENVFNNHTDSDESLFSTHMRLLSSMCQVTKNTIDNAIDILAANKLIIFQVIPQNVFVDQTNTIITTFLKHTSLDFQHTLTFIVENFRANQFMNMLSSNWQIKLTNAKEQYLINTVPRTFPIGNSSLSCSCDRLSVCSTSLMFSMNTSYPGLLRGCLAIDGLRLSTFECFAQSACLTQLLVDLAIDQTKFDIVSLNASLVRNMTIPIGNLIDELFVEEWKTAVNYTSYFSICAPLWCKYSFSQRKNTLDIINTLFGVYGGLTIIFRFLTPIVVKLYGYLRTNNVGVSGNRR